MSYQIIILIAISAVVFYFSIAELVWQFKNRHFRKRLIIGVLIAALLVSHIDFINLFTKTDAETVLAAAADTDTDASTENIEVSAIGKLSDGIKRRVATMGTALDELMQPDTWKVMNVSTDMDAVTVEETEVDGNLLAEERSDVTEGEILTETEESIEEENSAETENSTEEENPAEAGNSIEEEGPAEAEKGTEEENPAETEKGREEENSAEAEKGTEEEKPAETENNTEEENSAGQENSAEESPSEDSADNSAEVEKSSDEAKPATNTKTTKEVEMQTEAVYEDKTALLPAGGVMLMASMADHDSITVWTQWGDDRSLPSNGGNYYLTQNVNLDSSWTLEINGTVNLCLNGHTYSPKSFQIKPSINSTLNIYDCNGSHTTTYTITYNSGKYSKEEDFLQTNVNKGETTKLSGKIFNRVGYTQTGWATDDGGALKYGLGEEYVGYSDITLYPVWTVDTYQVTYEKDGGIIENEDNYTSYNYEDGLAKLPTPKKEGYEFIGWYDNDSQVDSIPPKTIGDKTFYAKWSICTYTITYNNDGGNGKIEPQTYNYGTIINLPEVPFTHEIYKQIGWSDEEDREYKLGESYTVNENITFHPIWAVTITYEPGESIYGSVEGSIQTQDKIVGKDTELFSEIFTLKGYGQTGWVTSDGKEYELGESYGVDQNITLYPTWGEVFIVTYIIDGKAIEYGSNYNSYVHGVGLKSLPTPTKSGYKFMGWYINKDFNGSAESSISPKAEGNKIFYAKWEKIITEDNNYDEAHYDNGDSYNDAGNSSSDSGDTGSGNTGNTQPGRNEKTDPDDADDTDETDEDPEDEDADTSKDKHKGKEKADDDANDIDDADDIDDVDSLDEQTEGDADDNMESSEESKKSTGEAGTKSVNRSVQAGLENGEIVISGNPGRSDGTGAGGNGAGGETSGEESSNASIGTVTIPGEESAATVLVVGEGSVIVTVVSDEWKYGAGVADTVAVANTVLTSEQKQLVNSGESIEIRLVVKDISGRVSEADRAVIEDGLKADREGESGKLVPAAYIDISLDIRTGDGDWKAVTRTDKPIKVVVGISEEWSDNRAFYIARSHESEYALLEDLDSESNTVTIMTELFSTYAIVYRQMPVIAIDADRISDFVTSHSWITVAGIGAVLLYIGILEIVGIIAILFLWKQYKKEKEDAKRDVVTP